MKLYSYNFVSLPITGIKPCFFWLKIEWSKNIENNRILPPPALEDYYVEVDDKKRKIDI